jgi:hypothetical protein
MVDRELLARMYHASITHNVSDVRAPHYAELAKELSLSPEDARVGLHDLEKAGVPGFWLEPNTDLIGALARLKSPRRAHQSDYIGHTLVGAMSTVNTARGKDARPRFSQVPRHTCLNPKSPTAS